MSGLRFGSAHLRMLGWISNLVHHVIRSPLLFSEVVLFIGFFQIAIEKLKIRNYELWVTRFLLLPASVQTWLFLLFLQFHSYT
jgi:hypothetical protein